MPRKNHSEEKRAQIIQAVCDMINQEPFEKITLRSIAERSGVPAGSIHYFFDSIPALIEEAGFQLTDQYIPYYQHWAEGLDESILTIEDLMNSYASFLSELDVMERSTSANYLNQYIILAKYPAILEKIAAHRALLAQIIADGISRTHLKTDQPSHLAYVLLAMTEGFTIYESIDPNSPARKDMFKALCYAQHVSIE